MRRPSAAPLLALAASLALAACTATPTATAPPTATPAPTATPVYRFGVVGNRGKIAQLERGTPTVVAGITGKVVQIATSNSDSYALTSAGTVWAWGVGSYGELGNGGTSAYVTRAVQVAFPAGVRIVALPNPMPFDGALAIDSLGRAWGWGLNANGDLCLAGLAELRPSRIPLNDVTAATGARTHSLFDSGGRVYACGDGEDGVLGNG
ncbi:MAG TPA: hypothetical protein VKH61_08465, partial [Streptosporangiaceae bacterium]|nr:hypothetical protein [Streptosporangiaceae bacterium]